MSKSAELNSYIVGTRRRLRLSIGMRGAAMVAATALGATVLLVLLLNHFAFPDRGVSGARLVLLLVLLFAIAFAVVLPLARLSLRRAVLFIEMRLPEVEHRLSTFHNRNKIGDDPFLELLAADTLGLTERESPKALIPDKGFYTLAGTGLGCLAVLAWLIAVGPGYMGYGASLLWKGVGSHANPLYTLTVAPGNIAVRRFSDQRIVAQVQGMQPVEVRLFAHYRNAKTWDSVLMQSQRRPGASGAYEFDLAGVPDNVEYYVTAGPLTSAHYAVRVVDLPSVKKIQVTYHYPKWTGMQPVTEERQGDLRAIEGTDAAIQIETDRALQGGRLLLEGGQSIDLKGSENHRYEGTIHMEKDGAYHLAAMDANQAVRLSEDYFIATDKAQPPQIAIDRPRGDYRASPVEEITVGVNAADQFPLRNVQLHYSINGGPDQAVALPSGHGAKQVQGTHMLPLEDYKLVPGDVVSVYASARDGHAEAHTDISFIQVDPFEREFSQSQQSGGATGAGGGQSNQTEISKREKELIAATWKQQNEKSVGTRESVTQGQFLSDAQSKLRDQVMALSRRMESRDLSAATEEFNSFNQDMQIAAQVMAPSSEKLKAAAWQDALPLEQRALQALLRAEATFRKIQVAFGQGGGGNDEGNAGRDLASLFDLELDTEKNQYETSQAASPAQEREKKIEDTLAKLDALAKRQEEEARQDSNPQQSVEQRWQQEMLRREAEQLRRQMEELARNGNGSQSSSQTSSAGSPGEHTQLGDAGQRSAGSGNSSRAPGPDPRIQQALRRLQDAAESMQQSNTPQQRTSAAQRAAEQLRQSADLLAGTQQQLASGKVDSLAQEAARLRQEERTQADQINQVAAGPAAASNATDLNGMMQKRRQRDELAQKRQQLSNDLSALQRDMRERARAMAANEPGAARQLRDALAGIDESDLDNRVQRSADWLRRGINPNSNGTEEQIAQSLQTLQQQLESAQREAHAAQSRQGKPAGTDQSAALDAVEDLRRQVESLSRARDGQIGRSGKPGDTPSGTHPSDAGSKKAGVGASVVAASPSGGERSSGTMPGSSLASGDLGGALRQGARPNAGGAAWNNINTGNNHYGTPGTQAPSPADAGTPADQERALQQGLHKLNELRQTLKGDPEAAKAAEELARQMQQLDPRRFPGNPEIVDQMQRELLGSIDRLELQIERAGSASVQARTGTSDAIPTGYKEAVAEYFRQLSKSR